MKKRNPTRASLTQLGRGPSKPIRKLEAFPNSYPKRDTVITFNCDEFTCLCPITGQPDFATLEISYIPNKLVLESKSLKLYLWTYRDVGIFHENVCNELLDALSAFLKPRWIRVVGRFYARGGIGIDVIAESGKPPKQLDTDSGSNW
jgi:7-cyano-7-deazaguanine reductase